MKIDAVLTQRTGDDGFCKNEIQELLEHLRLEDDEEVDAVYLEADDCIVFGFIRMQISEEKLGFDTGCKSSFGSQVIAAANDIGLENEDNLYDFAGVKTLMYY